MRIARLFVIACCLLVPRWVGADWYDDFPTTEAYLDYLGNRPTNGGDLSIDVDWTDSVNGITHDEDDWYITQSGTIFRVPLSERLDRPLRTSARAQHRQIESIAALAGYDHFGDISYYPAERVVLAPVDSGPSGSDALLAVFSADAELRLVDVVPFPGQRRRQSDGSLGSGQAGIVMVDASGLVYSMTNSGQCEIGTHAGGSCLRVYSANWDRLGTGTFRLRYERQIPLRGRDGSALLIQSIQGGVIAPSGRVAYLTNGWRCDTANRGLHALDLVTGREIARSGHGADDLFQYAYRCDEGIFQGESWSEEPEGLTIWDLDDRPNPHGIRGQLHVLLLDVQDGDDDVYFKHYSGKLFVDATRSDGDGTWEQPFPAFADALRRAWSGATIELLRGVEHSWGSAGVPAPLAIRAAPGVGPTLGR